jgi:hypothetical protein
MHSEHFFRRVLRATLPLLIWIAHFAFSYGLAAAQCTPAGLRHRWAGPAAPRLRKPGCLCRLRAAGLAPAASCAGGRTAGLLDHAAFLSALLAMVAIAWGAMPLFMVVGCS